MFQRFLIAIALLVALLTGACSAGQPFLVPPPVDAPPAEPAAVVAAERVPVADTSILAMEDTLPVDPLVRTGRLDNGFSYVIRRNTEPEQRAELWLVVDAGSVLEDEDQLGLAHFLEHMLFNGTRRFPEQELINFLESTGMEFGPDVNAFTSFDETVYMLQIPTDNEDLVQRAFEVLEDWAAFATLDDEEIEKERGVIVEEERLRDQNASGRIREQILPVLLGDSRYQDRLPIGDLDVIRNAPPEAIQRFYHTWYRPDLMALVAVGDIDPGQIESLVQDHFSALPAPADAQPRVTFDIPGHEDTRILVVTDPEYPSVDLDISYKTKAQPVKRVADYQAKLVSGLFDSMLSKRLAEISRSPDAPFVLASVSRSQLVRPADRVSFGARLKEDRVQQGLEVIMTEIERVRRHGFTEGELDRAKRDLLNRYELAYDDRENITNSAYAQEYLDYVLTEEAIPGIELELQLAQRLLSEITLAEVNQLASDLVDDQNRTVLLIGPEKDDLALPDEVELANVLEAVVVKDIEPYVDDMATDALMVDIPAPVPVVDEGALSEIGVTELELANGVRVLMKPTDFREEQVLFLATSPGGSSVLPDEDYAEVSLAAFLVGQSGVADLSATDLQKLLAGQAVAVRPQIAELGEALTGSAEPESLETLFQLIHLYMTEPRADAAVFETVKDQARAAFQNRELTPVAALQDTVHEILYDDSIRRRSYLTLEEIETLDFERTMAIFRDRYGDASDFTFVFVGNFDESQLRGLAQTYLGTLPAAGREETWQDVVPEPPGGIIDRSTYKGQEDQSVVQLLFTGPAEPSLENELQLDVLEGVLDILVREDLREERSGIYAASLSSGLSRAPDELYSLSVGFSADPERVDELTDAVFQIIEDLRVNGPAQEDVDKVKEQIRRNREEQLKSNSYWLSALEGYAFDPTVDPADILRYDELLPTLTANDVQQAAQRFLPDDRYIRVVLFPERFQPAEDS